MSQWVHKKHKWNKSRRRTFRSVFNHASFLSRCEKSVSGVMNGVVYCVEDMLQTWEGGCAGLCRWRNAAVVFILALHCVWSGLSGWGETVPRGLAVHCAERKEVQLEVVVAGECWFYTSAKKSLGWNTRSARGKKNTTSQTNKWRKNKRNKAVILLFFLLYITYLALHGVMK